jgi:hypothetical protein
VQRGMLLNSVAPRGGGGRRTPLGMLSYNGALDQITAAAAKAGGVSLGFVWRTQPLAGPANDEEWMEEAANNREDRREVFTQLQPRLAQPKRTNRNQLPKAGDRYVVAFPDGAMLRNGREMVHESCMYSVISCIVWILYLWLFLSPGFPTARQVATRAGGDGDRGAPEHGRHGSTARGRRLGQHPCVRRNTTVEAGAGWAARGT